MHVAPIHDGIEIEKVVVEGEHAIFILVENVEDSGEEGLFPSKEAQALSELAVVHPAELAQLLESFVDDFGLVFCEVGFLVFADFLARSDEFDELAVDDLGFLFHGGVFLNG